MTFFHTILISLKALSANKTRSILAMLGIVIGIGAIILIVSLGKGAERLILGELQGVGSKTIIILPGREPRGVSDIAQTFGDSLKERDLVELRKKSNLPHAEKIEVLNIGATDVVREGKSFSASIFGASGLLQSLFQIGEVEGRFINDEDVKSLADVAVIGSKTEERLFEGENPLGGKIRIKGKNFRVVGVMPKKGQASFINLDESIIVPNTTAQRYIFGIKYFHRIIAEVDAEENVPGTVEDIKDTLRRLHEIDPSEEDDFNILTQQGAMDRVRNITAVITLFVSMVAAISLIVAGVGIMNIMLVSVTERTAEIGIRKAVGASSGDIMRQFLFEAIFLTVAGGLVGVIFGFGISALVSAALKKFVGLNWGTYFSLTAALTGIGVSAVVGLIFGIYPARRASLKDPIESLRYE